MLYLPGLALAAAARVAPLPALATAPLLGAALLGGTGLAAGAFGTAWGWQWALGGFLVALAAVVAARVSARRRSLAPVNSPDSIEPPQAGTLARTLTGRLSAHLAGPLGQYLAGIALAAAVLGPSLLAALGGPEHFGQRFDSVFHLNAVRLVADTGAAAPWSFAPVGAGGAYPAGLYLWAGLVMQLTGVSVAVAMQAAALVVVFLIWPIAIAYLVEIVVRPRRRILVGALAFGSVSFPFGLMVWGILYPNFFGLALTPVLVALGWEALGMRAPTMGLRSAIVLLVAGAFGSVLVHPNALVAAAILLLPAAVTALLRARRNGLAIRSSRPWTGIVLAAVVAFPFAWYAAISELTDTRRTPFLGSGKAIGEILLGTSLGKPVVAVLAAGLLFGFTAAVRDRQVRPLVIGFEVAAVAYFATATFTSHLATSILAGPFYNDPYRTAAVLAIPTIALAAYGWDSLLSWVWSRLGEPALPRWAWRALAAGGAVVMALAVLASGGWQDQLGRIRLHYALDETSNILTADELALLERIPAHVPAGERIAANPWQGGSLAYAFAGRETTQPYMSKEAPAPVLTINASLRDAASNPAVCAALAELGANYALEMEPHTIPAVWQAPSNDGFVGLGSAPGFELLDSEGAAVLYRITACD